MMTKKDFIALADHIIQHKDAFSAEAIDSIARFCNQNNHAFKTDRWINYIAGNCGPNGGKR
jgi:hypothetical protein